ncbi:MAG TPA: iron-sulfur cluster insertion protein ErpA [Acetobacteraceae bacterium]|jgi:iron-sulfur cluster assembly accessory protein|nr:iron-sulfur cluster insertion protein ErpA [Acetobacteraceae bacterium]
MDTAQPSFSVSDRAARRIAEIVASQGGDAALRVEVQGGGCSGFRYHFDLDREARPDDLVIEREGARILVDTVSLDFLSGAELDYTEALMGAHFAVKNPNASSSCGCGESFSVD